MPAFLWRCLAHSQCIGIEVLNEHFLAFVCSKTIPPSLVQKTRTIQIKTFLLDFTKHCHYQKFSVSFAFTYFDWVKLLLVLLGLTMLVLREAMLSGSYVLPIVIDYIDYSCTLILFIGVILISGKSIGYFFNILEFSIFQLDVCFMGICFLVSCCDGLLCCYLCP